MCVAAEQYAKRTLGATEDDRFFSVSKLFFAYGLGNGLYFPLALGATSILWPGSAHPANVLGVIKEHRPTLLFSVPSNYSAILQHAAGVPKSELSSVRFAVSAGEPLPAVIFQRFKDRFGVEILDGIGSTEATHIFISNRPGAIRPGSTGQPVAGVEVRILDDRDRPVPQGEIGNLWAKSDAICERYWNRHELSKNTIRGEWISTGDKYWQDEDGFFWYAGRRDDMLKVSGVWVSPAEIESVLAEHPDVAESAVIAAADADTLLKPHAYVVLREGREPSAELAQALQDWVEQKLARYKRPRAIHFVASLPKTATGKIQRFALRQRSRDGIREPDTHSF
jgi:benzoate-CoA ligase